MPVSPDPRSGAFETERYRAPCETVKVELALVLDVSDLGLGLYEFHEE